MMNHEQTSQNIFKYNFILCQNMLHNLMFQAKEICVPFKNTSSEKDKVKVKNRVVVILQVVYIANVMNQKVINVSIVQKISVKR